MKERPRTQREIADISGVTEVTIRNRYKEMVKSWALIWTNVTKCYFTSKRFTERCLNRKKVILVNVIVKNILQMLFVINKTLGYNYHFIAKKCILLESTLVTKHLSNVTLISLLYTNTF